MAYRVEGWQVPTEPAVPSHAPAVESHVTPAAIDSALAAVERDFGLSSEVSQGLRRLLSADHTSNVAQAYYGALAHRGHQATQLRTVKKAMTIPYALSEDEVNALSLYAPDFKLSFRNTDAHDHPVYAAQRMIDQAICESRMPPGCRSSDLGGSVVHHASQGNLNWHVCSPLADRKDMARNTLQRLRLRKMAVDVAGTLETREYSRRVLEGDDALVCGKRAQECTAVSDVAVAVHVYDIPMQDWPRIMENKKLKLVEGCMLFSDVLMEQKSGLFPSAGVRYECDVKKDEYHMGFVDSPSWWYKHSLKEHLRYGVDQVLYSDGKAYSYKIVERRGDTIYFRILRVSGRVRPDVKQVYRLPGVPMVTVKGPEVSSKPLPRRVVQTWHWPEPLWGAMVHAAMDRLERGTFTIEDQFNRYRSVAPRQTINSVRVSGGHEAVIDDRVALVVYSTLEAVVALSRQRAAFDVMAAQQNRIRSRQMDPGIVNLVASLSNVVCDGLKYTFKSLFDLGKAMVGNSEDALLALYSVGPRVAYRTMPANLVLAKNWYSNFPVSADSVAPDFRSEVMAAAPADHLVSAASSDAVAATLLDLYGDSMQAGFVSGLRSRVVQSDSGTVGEGTGSTLVDGTDSGVSESEMTLAIQEAIQETELESKNVEASCVKFRNECMVGGEPNKAMLIKRKEEMLQPDFWYVNKGVVVKSLLGRPGDDFDLSALLLPIATPQGSYVHPVTPVVYSGPSKGRQVVVEHAMISDSGFTGWAFSNGSLAVYNGPEIVAALSHALKLVRPLKVLLHTGPAGCGKTTQIVAGVSASDVVLCPARASVLETRERLIATRPELRFDAMERCKTADSYLVHVLSRSKVRGLRTKVLKGDEAFMMRSGRWYACALLLGAERLEAYGDPCQIPHVPRALCPALHLRLKASEVDEKWITYRCPHDVVAAVGDVYGWKARSASRVAKSLGILASVDAEPVPAGCVMMCMYQDDKKVIHQKYASLNVPIRVMTVHEAQGNTFSDVRLHRFVRGKNQTNVPDAFDLFQKSEYVLVAMTRHTRSFRYLTQMGEDQVTARVRQGGSASRVNAAADVKSAGVVLEHA